MNKLTLAGALLLSVTGFARAADLMPLKAPPPMVVGWTGCYFGVNTGTTWSDQNATPGGFVTTGFVNFAGRQAQGEFPAYSNSHAGFIGGGQLGCNYQISSAFVIGLEADFSGTTLNSGQNFAFAATPAFNANAQSATQSLPWLGTVRGRLGYLVMPSWLVFVTGGLAYGQVDSAVTTIGVPNGFPGVAVSASSSTDRTGYAVGGGVEYALSNNWTAKLEYLHYDLGTQTLLLNYGSLAGGAGNAINYTFTERGDIVRGGLNLRF